MRRRDSCAYSYSGVLRIAGEEQICFHLTGPQLRLEACPKLCEVLEKHGEALGLRLQGSVSVFGCISELIDMLERVQQLNNQNHMRAAYYDLLVCELDVIGWNKLISLSPALHELQLAVKDSVGRGHAIGLSLPPGYPRFAPSVSALVPTPAALLPKANGNAGFAGASSTLPAHSLRATLEEYRAVLAQHQLLWDLLDDLDAHVWVVEPKYPSRACVTRRIAIGKHCTLQLTMHVATPSALPDLQFFGAEQVILPLLQALNANLDRWRPSRSVRENLEVVLDVHFPTPESSGGVVGDAATADLSVECAICYEYQLDGAATECTCDACSKPFHKRCLAEWLRGLPTTQQSFDRLFGECPYCSRPIAVQCVPGLTVPAISD